MRFSRDSISDEEIIRRFSVRDEQAISLTDGKYGAYIRKLAGHILGNEHDGEETQNDVYLAL